jgi:hypothetical protein
MGKKIQLVIDVEELGRKGGQATAANRTPGERKAAAAKALKARWDAYYKTNPEKLKAKREKQARLEREGRKGRAAK